MRTTAQKAAARAINRSRRKSDATWEMQITISQSRSAAHKQPETEVSKIQVYPIEQKISEREAAHYGFKHNSGQWKILLPGTLDLTTMDVLYKNGESVDIIKAPEHPHAGIQEYHTLYIQVRSEVAGGTS